MRESGAVQQLSKGDVEAALKEGGGEEGGMERDREGGGSSGILLLQGREMSCEVKVEMWRLLCE